MAALEEGTITGGHLSSLNNAQKKAVLHTEGPLLILAGAGAGKTKVITHRILHLIKQGVPGSAILAITFTNKAAKEMRERMEKLLNEDRGLNLPINFSERPFLSTFHSLGVHILKENSKLLDLPRHFAIFDRADSMSAVRTATKESGLDSKEFEPGRMLSIISKEKGRGVTLSMYQERMRDAMEERLAEVWERYEKILKSEGALDFDDLLLKTSILLAQNPEVRQRYQNTWTHIHIDEYQDTNGVQYEIARHLTGERKNICVVGDIDQSIYSWRGADFKNIMRFEKDYPNTNVVLLEQNYRSTKNILEAANTVIAKNVYRVEKNLYTENPSGEKLYLHGSFNEEDEAFFVAEKIRELFREKIPAEEIAILFRANFQSRALEEALINASIPYQVLGTKFFERKEVKDMLSYLRAALNPESIVDLRRIINSPARGVGKVSLLKILAGQEEKLPTAMREKVATFKDLLKKIKETALRESLPQTLLFIAEESGLRKSLEEGNEEDEERLRNIFELISVSEKYNAFRGEEAIEKLLTDAALATDQDELAKETPAVKLMTVHAAKGLEFDCVFITGLEEDLFPYERMNEKKKTEEGEEERRLFYVALTRARKKVFLSFAAVRTIFGSKKINIPSEFISDIDENLIEDISSGEKRMKTVYLE